MSDSLDLLLTRGGSASVRASPQASPSRPRQGSYARQPLYESNSVGNREYAAYTPTKATPHATPSKSSLSNLSYAAESKSPAPSPLRTSYESSAQLSTGGNSALGASLASSLASKLSSSGGSVDWSAFKAKRAASASRANAPAAASAQPQQAFVPTGPKSAAAGLSDSFVAASPAATSKASRPERSDDTVIADAVIPPMRSPSAAAKSAPAPAASPKRANPFAPSSSHSSSPVTVRPVVPSFSPPSAMPGAAPAGSADGTRAVQTFICPDCGRQFKRSSLMKHSKVCAKVFAAKREAFDSSKVRTQDLALDEDEEGSRPHTAAKGKQAEETKEQDGSGKSNWKNQSSALREAMRRAKKQQQAQSAVPTGSSVGIDIARMMPKVM